MAIQFIRPLEPELPSPADPKQAIWRYMDLAKFIAVLSTKSLWFARGDQLGDRFEGSLAPKQKEQWQALIKERKPSLDAPKVTAAMVQGFVRNIAVNCWHRSEHESVAMWSTYLRSGEGIAIRSTVEKLMNSIPIGPVAYGIGDVPKAISVEFGDVRYIDYNDESGGVKYGPLGLFLRKRRSFEHEREFRAMMWHLPIVGGKVAYDESIFPEGGVPVPVDVPTLVEEVFVVPGAAPWVRNVVASVVKQYGFDFVVHQSRLDEDPLF